MELHKVTEGGKQLSYAFVCDLNRFHYTNLIEVTFCVMYGIQLTLVFSMASPGLCVRLITPPEKTYRLWCV